jgi:NAD(P)-dependent dehydrogenase (short-subunit alcohol dehydrogenase family)
MTMVTQPSMSSISQTEEGKVLAIIGMGPHLGMAVARRFGSEGYRLGLVARNPERLESYIAVLASAGIEAAAFPADVCDPAQLEKALAELENHFGRIDALEYSPMINGEDIRAPADTAPENIMPMMQHIVYGAVTAANCVLAGMVARGDGVLLFTMGSSAVTTLPSHTNVAIAMAGLHRYVESLSIAFADQGIYAANFVIGELLPPDQYADILWNMATKRENVSVVIGDPKPLAAFETLVARGYAQPHPAKLIRSLPPARDDKERDTLLLALCHAHMTASQFEDRESIVADIRREVRKLGGDMGARYFGASVGGQE